MDRGEFERMKDEYYELRRWDVATGQQKRELLDDLGLNFVCKELEGLGLLKK
jgi:aldehyde:ferredoxin oxidoreductase